MELTCMKVAFQQQKFVTWLKEPNMNCMEEILIQTQVTVCAFKIMLGEIMCTLICIVSSVMVKCSNGRVNSLSSEQIHI